MCWHERWCRKKNRMHQVEEGGVPPVSVPPSWSGLPPSTLAAMLFTMFRMASKKGEKKKTHNAVILKGIRVPGKWVDKPQLAVKFNESKSFGICCSFFPSYSPLWRCSCSNSPSQLSCLELSIPGINSCNVWALKMCVYSICACVGTSPPFAKSGDRGAPVCTCECVRSCASSTFLEPKPQATSVWLCVLPILRKYSTLTLQGISP